MREKYTEFTQGKEKREKTNNESDPCIGQEPETLLTVIDIRPVIFAIRSTKSIMFSAVFCSSKKKKIIIKKKDLKR